MFSTEASFSHEMRVACSLTNLIIPLSEWKRMGYGKPVSVDLKIRGFAVFACESRRETEVQTSITYYAGNKSTFNAAATTAHCVMEGYSSAIEACAVCYRSSDRRIRLSWSASRVDS